MGIRDSLVEKELAQAEKMRAEAVFTRHQKKLIELEVAIKRGNFDIEAAKDFHNHFYLFSDATDLRNVTNCIEVLGIWHRLAPTCDIEIAFHSSGGSVMAGMMLFDFISRLKATHKVTTSVLGYSASMAAILLQAGTHRVVGKETFVLLHEITGQAVGKVGEIEDTAGFLKKIQQHVISIFLARSGGRIEREVFEKNWAREWWLDSEEMVRWGLADEVI